MTSTDRLEEMAAEIERLRAEVRILRVGLVELQTHAAITLGTLSPPTEDEPATVTHDIPPNAPR